MISLPGLTWRDAVKDGDRHIFVASHSNYSCYLAADQPAMRAFWQAQANYQARVEPRLPGNTTSLVAWVSKRGWW